MKEGGTEGRREGGKRENEGKGTRVGEGGKV